MSLNIFFSIFPEVPSMPFTRAQMLPTAFLADMLKPIATGMTSYRGKLCVPQSLYSWPFFIDVGGEIYDPLTNSWSEMPSGKGDGWPARQAGTKLSVVVDGELYALDPSTSLDSGKIKIYDHQEDVWKLHVITKDASHDIVIMQADPNHQLDSVSSQSSASSSMSLQDQPESSEEVEPDVWRIICSRNFGSAELVSCQVLDM
ncbi:hypothetical protein MKX01_032235 [Papaver californicum]|nr:hypothetical protein MKX01_032235 [Papaver californicum]